MAHGSVVQTVGWADIALIVKMYLFLQNHPLFQYIIEKN